MGRVLDLVVGQSSALSHLRLLSAANTLPTSLLLVGPEGIGKGLVAQAWIQEIFCEHKLNYKACGLCPSCLQIENSAFSEWHIIQPEKKAIRIDVIHELLQKLSLRAFFKKRIVLIQDAHLMNGAATNALLKTLEEPPEHTHFILTAPSEKLLLPTVRSRSQVLHFKRLKDEEVLSWAKRKFSIVPDWALAIAQGRLDLLEQLQAPEAVELQKRLLLLVQQVETNGFFQAEDQIKEVSANKDLNSLWAPILSWIYKQAATAEDSGVQFNYLQSSPRDQLLQKSALALKLETDLRGNRDPQLLLEQFFLRSYGIY